MQRLSNERGVTLVEMLIALIVLALGILGAGRLFPAGTRAQVQDRQLTVATLHAQEKLETLRGLAWTSADLSVGRHPPGTATESLDGGQWQRFYEVQTLAAPLDNLKRVDVTVQYQGGGVTWRSTTATTYLRR